MLIIFMVSTNVLLWTFSQNAIYTQAAKDENQKSADRLNENIVASGGNYSVSGDEVTVEVVLRNAGSVAAQIINLWVFDTNSSNRRYANKSLNYNLNPGDALYLVGSGGVMVPVLGADPSHDFISWFVTARGNTIPLEEGLEGVVMAQVAQGIGSLSLDFYTFRYFTYETDPTNKLKNYPSGNAGFAVPHGTGIAFGVVLTNLDPSKEPITFDNYTQIWLYCPEAIGATQAEPPVWYIVNVNENNGTIQASYSEISINYGDTKLIIFASKTVGSFSKVQLTKQDYKNKLFAVNLMLHGKLGDRDYGQNIPFVSLYCYETS